MYKLTIKFTDNTKIEKQYSENALRNVILNGFTSTIRYAKVITPSGVKKDITNIVNQY